MTPLMAAIIIVALLTILIGRRVYSKYFFDSSGNEKDGLHETISRARMAGLSFMNTMDSIDKTKIVETKRKMRKANWVITAVTLVIWTIAIVYIW